MLYTFLRLILLIGTIMNRKHRFSLISVSASFLFIAGMVLTMFTKQKDLKSAGAESKSYTLNLVSTNFLSNKYVTTTMKNKVNFSINNIMYYNDWKALTIPSSSGINEASFSNTTPIQQIKSISVTWGSGNLYAYSNYTIELKNQNKQAISSYTQEGLLNGKNEGTCNYDGLNATYLSFTFTYTMAITKFTITYSCS